MKDDKKDKKVPAETAEQPKINTEAAVKDADFAATEKAAEEKAAGKSASKKKSENIKSEAKEAVPMSGGWKAVASDQEKRKKNEQKKLSASSVAFYVVSAIAILALLALAASILGFGNVFESVAGVLKGKSPIQRDAVVMTVDGYEVTTDEYLSYAVSYKESYESYYGASYFSTPEMQQQFFTNVENYFIDVAMTGRLGREEGIALTEEEMQELRASLDDMIVNEYGGQDNYEHLLDANNTTDELLYKQQCQSALISRLNEYFFASDSPYRQNITQGDRDAAAMTYGIYSVKHILILYGETEEDDPAQLALAQQLLARIRGGEDFDELMHAYSDDSDALAVYPDGYLGVTSGEMDPAFESAAMALAVDQVSELVESSYGWHIIKRIATPDELLDDFVVRARVDDRIAEVQEQIDVVYGRGYKRITMDQIVWNDRHVHTETQEDGPTGGAAGGTAGDTQP